MKKNCHLFCVALMTAVMNVVIIESALTTKQMLVMGGIMRETCQPKFDIDDELIDGLKIGRYPENNELMCYVNCILELMTLIRNGVPNFDLAMKQMKTMLPEELRDPFIHGLVVCKDAAKDIVGDKCLTAYTLLECFYQENPKFMFP